MPAPYLAVRDSCIAKKKKENNGKISKEQEQECKKMAAIWYYKKFGKPVSDADASLALSDFVYYDNRFFEIFYNKVSIEDLEKSNWL